MKGPRKGILSVRICILSSKSCILSTRVCLKYVNLNTEVSEEKENGLKEHRTLIILMKIRCFVLFW